MTLNQALAIGLVVMFCIAVAGLVMLIDSRNGEHGRSKNDR